ncbi:MAG: hypothetical protein Q9209_000973 [Squamulea sp. 1 TL-2023]
MVATRSQKQEYIKHLKASPTTKRTSNKRKRNDEPGTSITFDQQAKKPKLEGVERSPEKNVTSTLAAVVIPTTSYQKDSVPTRQFQDNGFGNDGASESRLPEAQEGRIDSIDEEQIAADVTDNSFVEIGQESKPQASANGERLPRTWHTTSSTKFTTSGTRNSRRPHMTELPKDAMSSEDASPHDRSTRTTNAPSNQRHKRFENEAANLGTLDSEPSSLLLASPNPRDAVRDTDSVSSEDEAPDIVPKSSGEQEARWAVAEAIKAADTQRAAEKQKRKDRDLLLKSQAKISRKGTSKPGVEKQPSDVPVEHDEDDQKSLPRLRVPDRGMWTSKDPLPALLPDDILAAEPMARIPTPPLQNDTVKPSANTKIRFLDKTSKPPKDIKNGNVRIRVLEDRRAILPPKVSKNSQMLRESWLAGRPGPKGRIMMERRKMGTGFVRR